MPATDAFDVIGVNRSPANGRDGFVQLAGLINAISMHGDLDIIGFGHAQRLVDNTWVAGIVLMHLETTRPGLDLAHQRIAYSTGGTPEDAQVERLVFKGAKHLFEVEGGVVVQATGD